ncbi:MAG: aminotransferase class I/II-fold pyridoxal phosphate-dependent enzyme [Desulfobulbus sp.]|jgi:8-amino-7-oxononanoate synthase
MHPYLEEQLRVIRDEGRLRFLVDVVHLENGGIEIDGRTFLNLSGNDYLGIATNRALAAEFFAGRTEANALAAYGLGSTGSRMMTGNTHPYALLEERLRALYRGRSVLVFNSGYHANVGLLPGLAGKADLILADKLCHASMIDGMRLARARVIRYPHLDYQTLERLLARHRDGYRQVFIVTESIFSMDGDIADLAELVRIKERWNAALYVDEAHGVGARGATGCGLAEEQGVLDRVDILVGTFGKAYGGQGAFVVGSDLLIQTVLNTARPQIFSTGLPPISVHWLCFVLDRIVTMDEERHYLADLAARFRRALREAGLGTGGESNIIPVMIGDAVRAVAVAEAVREQGYWVTAVRPPTVPAGTSRLRLSLNAAMRWEQLEPLPALIAAAME